jgi:salicylate hydroxylase
MQATISSSNSHNNHDVVAEDPATSSVVIVGAGIVGLTLALALNRHAGLKPALYEAASTFVDDVGAGMGMYPNGLRVLRDVDPDLVQRLRQQGQPHGTRRWERSDGSVVMEAHEDVLAPGEPDLEPFGIRRYKLQRELYRAVLERGIRVHFSHRLVDLVESSKGKKMVVAFECGARVECDLVFAADGGRSTVRNLIVPTVEARLEYSGVTCIMGIAEDIGSAAQQQQGIAFPTSTTSRCHAVFFPTGPNEQCFMINVSVPAEETSPGSWGQLSHAVGTTECRKLADILRRDGWDDRFVEPLMNPKKAIRIGYCLLRPKLTRWAFGPHRRVVLVGDAAHPPIPYTGQGAQQGLEDAGTIALLVKHFCVTSDNGESEDGCAALDWTRWRTVAHLYEKIRIPHADRVCDMAIDFGRMQQRRADSAKYDVVQSEKIQREVFFHETLPCLLPGATHDYRRSVRDACDNDSCNGTLSHLPMLLEEK